MQQFNSAGRAKLLCSNYVDEGAVEEASVEWIMVRRDLLAYYRGLSFIKVHFKSTTAERRHVLCVGVGGDRTHAARPQGSRQGMSALTTRVLQITISVLL